MKNAFDITEEAFTDIVCHLYEVSKYVNINLHSIIRFPIYERFYQNFAPLSDTEKTT